MWRKLWNILARLPTVVGFAVTCLGFLVDFPVAKDGLQDSVSALSPVVGESLPWMAWGGLVICMVVLGMWLYQWIVDRLNDGPSVRRFRALAAKLRNCQAILLLFFDAPTPSEIERT